jgi:hypothetical protein
MNHGLISQLATCYFWWEENVLQKNPETIQYAQFCHALHFLMPLYQILRVSETMLVTRFKFLISWKPLYPQMWARWWLCREFTSWITSDYSKYQRGTLVAVTKKNRRNVWLVICLLKTGRNLVFFTQLKHPHTKVAARHPVNFNMKNHSFRMPYHYRAIYIYWI